MTRTKRILLAALLPLIAGTGAMAQVAQPTPLPHAAIFDPLYHTLMGDNPMTHPNQPNTPPPPYYYGQGIAVPPPAIPPATPDQTPNTPTTP